VTVDMQPTITPSNWEIEGDLSIAGTTGGGGGVGTLAVLDGGTIFVDGNLARVRGRGAHGRNFEGLSIVYDGRILGVCLSRGSRWGRLFDSNDLLRR